MPEPNYTCNKYLSERMDADPALFVSGKSPHTRLTISGVEKVLRELGKEAEIAKVHPHRFRRTLATMAIDKGMPIEQVQKLLGHVKNRYDHALRNGKQKQRKERTPKVYRIEKPSTGRPEHEF